jgi:hypothetical protein
VNGEPPRDERAERRERRRQARRERMPKHGARTGAVYRDAVLKRLRKKAGRSK